MVRLRAAFFRVLFVLMLLLAAALPAVAQDEEEIAHATIYGVDGSELGSVTFVQITEDSGAPGSIDGIGLWVYIDGGLEPGFHGLHIHAVGACDASTERPFSSAGGHLTVGEETHTHGQHAGDLPSLLVLDGGQAVLATGTNRFTAEDLLDADGSALIIHAGPDNFGNIPADRYDPDPDETTLNTGDAGGRVGCGVIEAVS